MAPMCPIGFLFFVVVKVNLLLVVPSLNLLVSILLNPYYMTLCPDTVCVTRPFSNLRCVKEIYLLLIFWFVLHTVSYRGILRAITHIESYH
ncbi:hypothetical protein FKM82_015992 [Ascaphus truei]